MAVPVQPHQGEGTDLHLSLLELLLETKLREKVTASSGFNLKDCDLCKCVGPDRWELLIAKPLGSD